MSMRDAVESFVVNVTGDSTRARDVDEITEILSKAGHEIDAFLGSGSFGNAFTLKGGDVLKLTADPQEASACAHLLESPHHHCVRVIDIFQIGEVTLPNWRLPMSPTNIYGIVEEILDLEVGSQHGLVLDRVTEGAKDRFSVWPHDLVGMEEAAATKLLDEAQEAILIDLDKASERLRKKNTLGSVAAARDLDGVRSGIQHLRRLGILCVDFHSRNVGKRDGIIKIFDPGVGQVKPARIKVRNPHWYNRVDARVEGGFNPYSGILVPIPVRIEG